MTTTIAPTMIKGGSAASNVMPHNVDAIVNMRVAQDMTTEQVLTHVKQAVGDDIDVSEYLYEDIYDMKKNYEHDAVSVIKNGDKHGNRKQY